MKRALLFAFTAALALFSASAQDAVVTNRYAMKLEQKPDGTYGLQRISTLPTFTRTTVSPANSTARPARRNTSTKLTRDMTSASRSTVSTPTPPLP